MILDKRFIVFIIGGFISAVVDISVMQFMILSGLNNLLSVTVGFVLGLIINYLFHVTFTFQSISNFYVFTRFIMVVLINYAITVGFVSLSFYLINNALIGKVLSLPVIAINGFVLSKVWVFSK